MQTGDARVKTIGRCGLLRWGTVGLLVLLLWALAGGVVTAQGVTYVVRSGDSLSMIALSNGVTVDAIVQANGLPGVDFIWVGQKLIIPGQAATPGRIRAGETGVYIVKLGDTLASIAHNLGVSQTALVGVNNMSDPDLLWVGQKLVVPGPPDASSLPPQAGTQIQYTVVAGDTLGRIAQRYSVTAAAIARANNLTSPDLIRLGMKLVIPGPESAPIAYTGQASRFVVSITQQRCWLYAGTTIIADWPCSTGQRGAGTNPGTYTIQSKIDKAYGSTWNIWMPYWLGIYWAGASENGIHGIPYDASRGWRLWEGYVGTPVTFGCVLLSDENAKTLYDLAYIGMPVIIQP
ncbi:MAG: LysM peptidoglycan-binding domain-containing protein [Chloroflexi bacterium]|nr:LysM peptidoglycan-binding domain-containing protein [Chloroflexota bacterium]